VPRVRGGGSDRSFTRDGRVKTCRSTFYTLLARVYIMPARTSVVYIPTGDGDRETAEEGRKPRKTDAPRRIGLSAPRFASRRRRRPSLASCRASRAVPAAFDRGAGRGGAGGRREEEMDTVRSGVVQRRRGVYPRARKMRR